MNLSEVIDRVVELRQGGTSPDQHVAEFLESTLSAGGANVQVESFAFSEQTLVLVGAAVLALSMLFLASVLKRRHRVASISALAIPVILLLELLLGFHVVSWPVLKKADNIVVHFPVQDAARTVVVGTHYGYEEDSPPQPSRFEETTSAFLLPMTLVITLLGLWQLIMYFDKLDFEDAHTIMLVMGIVCAVYYVLWFGVTWNGVPLRVEKPHPDRNAGSIAVLTGLAQDMSQKHPRLENTWVTVAFFGNGGTGGHGAKALARNLSKKRNRTLPTYFIGCEELGRGGPHGYVIPDNETPEPPYADRELIRNLNRAATAVTGSQLEIVTSTVTDSTGFVRYGYPAIAVTTLPGWPEHTDGGASGFDGIDRGQLLLSLQLIEKALMEFETHRFR